MSGPLLGLGLAALASVALNASYLLQHQGSRAAPDLSARHPVRSARALLGSPWWLAGTATGLAGWALFVVALARAPLSLVQMFAGAGLILTVPAAALAFRRPLGRSQTIAVVAMVAALSVLAPGAAAALPGTVPAGALALALAAAVTVASVLIAVSPGGRRASALGAAGGVLYGAGDAAMKAVTIEAHRGGLAGALTSPWLVAVAGLSLGAFACFQRGLQIGPPVPVIALMTAGTSAAAVLIGLLALGEPLGGSPWLAALHLAGFVGAGVAAVALVVFQERIGSVARHRPAPAGPAIASVT